MMLEELGWDSEFARHAEILLQPGQEPARVMAVDRGTYLLRGEAGEIAGELSGRFRFEAAANGDVPGVGDWVCMRVASPDLAVVHALLPRRSVLCRKQAGRSVERQTIGANIDVAFLMQSCHYDFNVRRLERYLVACRDGGIEPVVLLSKADLLQPEELALRVAEAGRTGMAERILTLSTRSGTGLELLQACLEPRKTFCFVGSSGVGKSTLVNALMGRDTQETRGVSGTGEGRHTTTRRELFRLANGAWVVDTPGMRELGMAGGDEGLNAHFEDVRDLVARCRFSDCTHSGEPGCAVRQALEAGDLEEGRLQHYHKLRRENEHYNRSHAEKRQRDKAFSKHVKAVLKSKPR
jgi:ribosome biogenesis GTPase